MILYPLVLATIAAQLAEARPDSVDSTVCAPEAASIELFDASTSEP